METAPHGKGGNRLASVILLAGSVRPSPLQVATGRQAIELPVDAHRTLLDVWQDEVAHLAAEAGPGRLQLTVLLNGASPSAAQNVTRDGPVLVQIKRDPVELRGTGGLLRDAALDAGDPDDFLLVTSSAKVLARPLAQILAEVSTTEADAVVAAQADGAPTSIIVIRRRCLGLIPDIGFVDLKEQAMPAIAKRYPVAVLPQVRPIGIPIRTLGDYINALRWRHTPVVGGHDEAFAESWSPAFSLVEDRAAVGAGAQILDSVVLEGARVEPGAVVVRSVVCPGGVVQRGRVVTDSLVTRARRLSPASGGKAGR